MIRRRADRTNTRGFVRLGSWTGWIGWTLAALLLGVFLATLWASVSYVRDPKFIVQSDSKSFVATARHMRGENDAQNLRPRRPVYPLLLLACDGIDGEGSVGRVRLTQTLIYGVAGTLLVAAFAAVLRSPWPAAGVALVLLLHRDGWCFANAVMSESITLSLFFLFAAATLVLARAKRFAAVGWFVVALLLGALAQARQEFAVAALLPCIGVAAMALRPRAGRWRTYAIFFAVGICVPLALSRGFTATRGAINAVSSPSGRRWHMLAKMVAPHFYVGPENSADENAIALLWNCAYRHGRVGSQAPRNEFWYVRQCYPRYQRRPLSRFDASVWADVPGALEYDRPAFNDAARRLTLRSLRHSPWQIGAARLLALREWASTRQSRLPPYRVGSTGWHDLRRDLKGLDYRDLPVDIAAVMCRELPVFYRLHRNILIFGVLFIVYLAATPRRHWVFLALVGLLLWGVFLPVGLFYQGFQARYKIVLHPGFWLLNIFMLHAIWQEVGARIRARKTARDGSETMA